MVPTTRSRGATAPTNSNDDESSSNTKAFTSAMKQSNSTNNKVYRKAPPKAELQQLQFPAKRKTVRAKKTRHSLPNPSPMTKKGKRKQEDEDLKQKTLTQMRWTDFVVPSTFQSDEEDMDDIGSDGKQLVVDLTAEDSGESALEFAPEKASSASKSGTKKKKTVQAKQPAEWKNPTNRGRKRRKTTGDLELELEDEDDEDEGKVPNSKYHTQTLTQMPSWKSLADMVPGSLDEELGFGFIDDRPDAAHFDSATPPSKRKKRASPAPEQEPTVSQHTLSQPLESTITSSAIPETPSRQRATRTEIPSSQPSPFTPNLDVGSRFWSPLGSFGVDRTPLKERSTNVDAPTPTVRKKSRSEIPDSWSTVNGGLPSSNGNSSANREPLKEIRWADVSVELGENDRDEDVEIAEEETGEMILQKPTEDIVMDSDDEFEGFPDVENEAPGTPSPRNQPSQEPAAWPNSKDQTIIDSLVVESTGGSPPSNVDAASRRPALHVAMKLDETQRETAKIEGMDAKEVMSSSPAEEVTAPMEATSTGPHPAISNQESEVDMVGTEAEDIIHITPSGSTSFAQRTPPQPSSTRHSPMTEPPTEEDMAMHTQMMRKTTTKQLSSHPVTERIRTSEVANDEDEAEPETPDPPRRRPSSSSVVEKETPFSSPQKTSPTMPPISQLGYKSQAFESQRVPFEIIQQMAPQTDRSDVITSADLDEVKHITEGTLTHMFRDFRIPRQVMRIWIYTRAPVCQLKYMATISDWKMPGDISPQDQGLGTADFNANRGTKYAYELLQVYELNNPVTLERMKADGWVEQAPLATGITYVPPGPLGALMANLKWELFGEHGDESQSHNLGPVTVSQEVEEQLKSDIKHSTQLMRGGLLSSPARKQPRLRHAEELQVDEHMVVPSSQNGMEDHIRDTPMRTKFSLDEQVVFAKLNAPPSRSQLSMVELDDGPPVVGHSSQHSQRIIKSTVRPSQATTVSAPSQSQHHERTVEFLTISASPSPVRTSAVDKSSSLPVVVDDSPIQTGTPTMNGHGSHTQSSSLGLSALLASSQGLGLAGIGGEQDSLMDDSKIRMPPDMEGVIWDSEGE
ncbi:hypothetical protein N0V82_001435 [Gnomoniopsis sp. IMI 355080]|nr:hypothetical protein N0V82_001435 [Gnomoniopsis sp. IMI 355080]